MLVKTTLGTVRATCYDLPSVEDFQHEYGLRQKRDGLTSGDVVGGWLGNDGTAKALPPRDFKQLNAMAVVSGGYSSKDFADFRKTHDARLKVKSSKFMPEIPYDETTTFGRTSQPELPFNDLITHGYRFDWASQAPPAQNALAAAAKKKPGQTRTSALLAKVNKEKLDKIAAIDHYAPEPSSWKMSSFAKVPPKVGPTG